MFTNTTVCTFRDLYHAHSNPLALSRYANAPAPRTNTHTHTPTDTVRDVALAKVNSRISKNTQLSAGISIPRSLPSGDFDSHTDTSRSTKHTAQDTGHTHEHGRGLTHSQVHTQHTHKHT